MVRKTFITITFNSRRHTFLVDANIVAGRAIVQQSVIDRLLDKIGVRWGQTYTIG